MTRWYHSYFKNQTLHEFVLLLLRPFHSASPTDVARQVLYKTNPSFYFTNNGLLLLRLNVSVEGKVLVNVECFHSFALADVHN